MLTIKQYAERRGVSESAVRKAIAAGRLTRSVGEGEGGRVVVDAELADREWEANTDTSRQPSEDSEAFRKARARKEHWLSLRQEVAFRRETGELVPVSGVRRAVEDAFTSCRTSLLALPSRARQALPHLTASDVGTLENLVREALEQLGAHAVDRAAPPQSSKTHPPEAPEATP